MNAQAASTPVTLPSSRLATVEALLRARKLDRTLTTGAAPDMEAMPLDLTVLDARLAGGLPRGQLSEVVGPASSGRTSLVWAWLGAATRRGEYVALVDTFDRFDPASGAACGLDLSRLLWVRGQALSKTASAVDPAWLPGVRTVQGPGTLLERTIDRALKALNLVLQSGVCTAVAVDLADVPAPTLGRIPASTWMRVQRIIEGSDTACVVLGPMPIARSAAGITIDAGTATMSAGPARAPRALNALQAIQLQGAAAARAQAALDDAPQASASARAPLALSALQAPYAPQALQAPSRVHWAGEHDRSRRLAGLDVTARLMSPRRRVAGTVMIDAQLDASV